jgi:dipeptidyl aminopeptidase/acylaminoacyl peptidase
VRYRASLGGAFLRRIVLAVVRVAFVAAFGLIAVAGEAASAVQVHDEAAAVAYTRVLGDRSWITVADLAGTGGHEITKRPRKGTTWDDQGPVWSPDGSWLAFVRKERNGAASGLFVAKRDGTNLRRVLRLPISGRRDFEDYFDIESPSYAWSPDGRRLAFANGPLYVVNRDGTNSRTLVPSSTCKPSWSPDGKSLVYLMDAFCSGRGANSPDPGHRTINRIDADGSHRRQLASGSFGDVSWSPDGRQIAFTNGCRVYHGGDWFCSVSVMQRDGSGKRRLVKSSYGGWVEWVAGGKEVLWPSYPSFQAANVSTGSAHGVLPASYVAGYPVGMSRDGQRIAVLAAVGYEIQHAPHPVPPLIIMEASGRLLQDITVPRGWESRDASVYLR